MQLQGTDPGADYYLLDSSLAGPLGSPQREEQAEPTHTLYGNQDTEVKWASQADAAFSSHSVERLQA